jgi:hypothetical protein
MNFLKAVHQKVATNLNLPTGTLQMLFTGKANFIITSAGAKRTMLF